MYLLAYCKQTVALVVDPVLISLLQVTYVSVIHFI